MLTQIMFPPLSPLPPILDCVSNHKSNVNNDKDFMPMLNGNNESFACVEAFATTWDCSLIK